MVARPQPERDGSALLEAAAGAWLTTRLGTHSINHMRAPQMVAKGPQGRRTNTGCGALRSHFHARVEAGAVKHEVSSSQS